MNNEKRIIEINGIKLEIDTRTATNVESYKIGDCVKVLIEGYSDSFSSYPGVIIGFDNFQKLPTILIAYLVISYKEAKIEFVCFNSASKKIEICPATSKLEVAFEKSTVLELLDAEILKAQEDIKDLKNKKQYFLQNFNKYFEVK